MRLAILLFVLSLCNILSIKASGEQITVYEELYNCLQNCAFCQSGHLDAAFYSEELRSFDINTKDPNPQSDGCSLLHVAVGLGGCKVCVGELLRLGAAPYQLSRVTECDPIARTPVQLARHLQISGLADFMEQFFFKKILDCIQENNGDKLALLFTQNPMFDTRFLVIVNDISMTLLHYDILNNAKDKNTSCTSVLLNAGFHSQLTDSNGLTCMSYAKQNKDFGRIRLMKKANKA